MGRSRGGLIVAPSHIKMNKLLLALAAGSSEEENQVERFESGIAREAREADPAKGQWKNQAKKKNQSKRKSQSKKKNQAKRKNQDKRKNKKGNKKGRSNKRKGLKGKKGGKGQKGKRNNKKNGMKSGKGNKNRKSKGNQKKMGKNGNKKGIRKNQNRMNTAGARSTCLSTTCVDTAVAAMKLLKDKVDNFEKQEKRISKKSNIGSKKSAKKDVFGPTLQRLSDAAGGNLSAPVCAGNASSPGAAQMLNLSMTLQTCDDDIFAANDTRVAECKAAIATFKNYPDTCTALDGAAACDCWTPSAAVTAATAEIKACDLSSNNTAVVTAVKACKAAFGKCRKYEDDVGDIIFSCEQNADTLKLKLKALSDNSDKVGQVATKVDALVNATRRNFASGRSAKAKRDASTAAGFISICTQINTWVVENPYYYQISSYATTIISVTAPVFTAADLTALSVVNTALQVSVTTLTVAVTTLQSTILELTGATVSDAELDALPSCEADPDVCYPDATTVGTTATTGTTGTTGTTTTGTTGTTTTGTTGTTSDVCVCTTAEGTTVTTPLSTTVTTT